MMTEFKELAEKVFKEIEEFGVQLEKEPTQTIWFRNMLICLLSALLREYRERFSLGARGNMSPKGKWSKIC